jgi:hypothetical protein
MSWGRWTFLQGISEGIDGLEFDGEEEWVSAGVEVKVACCEVFPGGFTPPRRLNAALAAAFLGDSELA